MMPCESVLEFINLLTAAGIPVWLDGGWGIDALVGEQTRLHDDLDVVIALDHAADAQRVLSSRGFQLTEDERPTRFVLQDASDRRIDFHTVTFDSEGGGIQVLQNGASFRYPPEGFRAVGTVGGVQLRCLTAEVQMLCHCGYAPDDTDRHDVQLLHERFGLPLPPGYDA